MARQTTKKEVTEKTETVKEAVEVKQEKPIVTEKVEKKKFAPTDGVLCRSVLSGKTYIKGKRTGTIYEFLSVGDKVEIEYQDLIAEVREGSGIIFYPMIMIEDEDFIKEFPRVEKYYSSMYTNVELESILRKSAGEIKKTLPTLPKGVQDSLKNIAAKMISNGELDSISVIKALDECWNTNLALMTGFVKNDF